MLIGYARTSTAEQAAGLLAQERDLKAGGCERLFTEHVSSVAKRDQLAAVLDFVRDGDKLIVTRLDRLARSMTPPPHPRWRRSPAPVRSYLPFVDPVTERIRALTLAGSAKFSRSNRLALASALAAFE